MINNLFKFLIFGFLFLIKIDFSNAQEEFNFDITEIQITQNGNLIIGTNGGIAKTLDGYEIVGDLHQGLEDRYDKLNWTSITQEFGTFKPVDVLMASRAENRWTQWGKYFDQNEAKRHWSRKNMLRTFCPNDPIWEIKITSRGKNVFNIARDDLLK